MTSNFQLLALRPLRNCSKKYLKNLTSGCIYKFYDEYSYFTQNEEAIRDTHSETYFIEENEEIPKGLYNLKNNLKVNISAIVGKNGSGKSTLIELYYILCYVLACKADIIETFRNKENRNKTEENNFQETLETYNGLKMEAYYLMNGNIHCITNNGDSFTRSEFKAKGNRFFLETQEKLETIEDFKSFLSLYFPYTVAINYSLYGLNSEFMGNWVQKLFHKNDGYQTPLVVNPYRTEGNINVNNELHLAQTRLLTNIIKDKNNKIVNKKEIDTVVFEKDNEKYIDKIDGPQYTEIFQNFKNELGISELKLIRKIDNILYGEAKFSELPAIKKASYHFDFLCKYIFRKILKISSYPEYRNNIHIDKDKNLISEQEFFKFCNTLSSDRSHITLKLRQVLNTLRFNLIGDEWLQAEGRAANKTYKKISLETLVQRIQEEYKPSSLLPEEIIPIGCYNVILQVNNYQANSNLDAMSSGEQHFVHSLNSILYHIINLNSVFSDKQSQRIKYSNVNIILDEIELYYHPEFQRTFIMELLKKLGAQQMKYINSINILFSTHSPFILSDIPAQNILRLDNGEIQNPEDNLGHQTLAANIHELLDNDFFLENGFMGEFIKDKVYSLIHFLENDDDDEGSSNEPNFDESDSEEQLKYNWSQTKADKFIQLIGEPVLRATLRELYYNRYLRTNSLIEQQIEILKKLKDDRN